MDLRSEDRLSAARAPADIPTLLLFGGAGLSAFFGGYQLLETYFLIPRFGTHTLYLMHMLRGITASMLLGGFVGWYLVQHPTIVQRFAVGWVQPWAEKSSIPRKFSTRFR